jgi:hypothetical protein
MVRQIRPAKDYSILSPIEREAKLAFRNAEFSLEQDPLQCFQPDGTMSAKLRDFLEEHRLGLELWGYPTPEEIEVWNPHLPLYDKHKKFFSDELVAYLTGQKYTMEIIEATHKHLVRRFNADNGWYDYYNQMVDRTCFFDYYYNPVKRGLMIESNMETIEKEWPRRAANAARDRAQRERSFAEGDARYGSSSYVDLDW